MGQKLYEPALRPFLAGAFHPAGWLRRQLEIYAGDCSGIWTNSGLTSATVNGSAAAGRAGNGSPTGWTASCPWPGFWTGRT